MRKIQISIVTFFAALAFFACKKETDQILSADQLGTGSYLYIDKTNANEFNYASIGTSAVSWDGHIVGEAADKVVSYVSSSSNSANKTTWKKIKETQVGGDGKVTISVTGTELATALGIQPTSLSPGNQYVIYNEVVTKTGKVYNYNNTNSDFEAAAAYSMGMRLFSTITCPFDPTGFAGDFEVVSDSWADFNPGEVVKVTAATANSITLEAYPAPGVGSNRVPITVTINPANGRATMARQTYGDYGGTQIAAATSTARTSYIFSCTGDVILYLSHTGPSGSPDYGTYLLRLKKI